MLTAKYWESRMAKATAALVVARRQGLADWERSLAAYLDWLAQRQDEAERREDRERKAKQATQ